MNLYSFEEAVNDYEKLTNEGFEFVLQKENLKLLDTNDFMTWKIIEFGGLRCFEIRQTYGFIKRFIPWIKQIMKEENLQLIITMTQRNPAAHIRKWKMSWLKDRDYDFEGRHYHVLIGNVYNLK